MSQTPTLSIIIPTHNRSALLIKSLEALSRQSWPAAEFEVLVVADACHDNTLEMVTAYSTRTPYRLRVLHHRARNAAATRNLGAANAQGTFLLFLDDDIVAQPGLVQAHMHAQHRDSVVLGYAKPILPISPSWWQHQARLWWEDRFRGIGQSGYRFRYRDFFSGNVSLPSAVFLKVGGFDPSFRRLEDYELGFRLLKAGVRFCYVPEAIGHHYETTDLPIWLRRIRQEGEADIQIGRRHSELRASLFTHFAAPSDRRKLFIRKLAFGLSRQGNWLERLLLPQAALTEQLRLRGPWQNIVGVLREYNYWRGVATAIGTWQALVAWLQEVPMPPAIASHAPMIDMTASLPDRVLQKTLAQATGMGLRLAVAGIEVLSLPPQPGAEPLREEHLHDMWRQLKEQQFIPALAWHMIAQSRGELRCVNQTRDN
jgi:glycosyltransferase involved in cell wall biosynthesis